MGVRRLVLREKGVLMGLATGMEAEMMGPDRLKEEKEGGYEGKEGGWRKEGGVKGKVVEIGG